MGLEAIEGETLGKIWMGQTNSLPLHRSLGVLLSEGSSDGGHSSAGRAPDCGSGCRGFESHWPPQLLSGKR